MHNITVVSRNTLHTDVWLRNGQMQWITSYRR